MPVLIFFDNQGQYNNKLYPADLESAIEIVLRYRSVAPTIIVTENDEIVLEVQQGKATPPVFDHPAIQRIEAISPSKVPEGSAMELMEAYRDAMVTVTDQPPGPLATPSYLLLEAIEVPLLAFAAKEGIDLSAHGYQPAGALVAEHRESRRVP